MNKILLIILIGTFLNYDLKIDGGNITSESSAGNTVQKEKKFPDKNGFINDFENIFTQEQGKILREIVDDYETKFGREIYIISTSVTYGYINYDELMSAFFQKCEVGKLPEQNGLIILMSKQNRKFAITAGLEAQKYLTDEKINDVIGMKVIPKLKANDLFAGTKNALDEIIKLWK